MEKRENNLKTWCEDNGEWGKQIEEEWVGEDEAGNPIKIDEITYGAGKRVKWRCRNCGEIWIRAVSNRVGQGGECPNCRTALEEWCNTNGEYGQQLKDEWTGKYRQGDIIHETSIGKITRLSNADCIWKCSSCGQEFEAKPFHRIMYKVGCPKCSKQELYVEKTSGELLSTWCNKNTLMDMLFSTWTGKDDRGKEFSLNDICIDSKIKLQWKCINGHEYTEQVYRVVQSNLECPLCSKYKNSLDRWCRDNKSHGKIIRMEWAGRLESGATVDIKSISISDTRPVTWVCKECGAKWVQSVYDRLSELNECPCCMIKKKYKVEFTIDNSDYDF